MNAPLTVHQCTAAVFSVISYVVLIVINHPKL